jgi:ABC-type transporter Mla MlaB component
MLMANQYRIRTVAHPEKDCVVLLLGGKFDEDALPELWQSVSEARCAQMKVFLDLSEITLVDRTSVKYFSEQPDGNVKVVNCPNYLRRWIQPLHDDPEN